MWLCRSSKPATSFCYATLLFKNIYPKKSESGVDDFQSFITMLFHIFQHFRQLRICLWPCCYNSQAPCWLAIDLRSGRSAPQRWTSRSLWKKGEEMYSEYVKPIAVAEWKSLCTGGSPMQAWEAEVKKWTRCENLPGVSMWGWSGPTGTHPAQTWMFVSEICL